MHGHMMGSKDLENNSHEAVSKPVLFNNNVMPFEITNEIIKHVQQDLFFCRSPPKIETSILKQSCY